MNRKIYIFITNKNQEGMIKNILKKENLDYNTEVVLVTKNNYGQKMNKASIIFISKQVKQYYMDYVMKVILPLANGRPKGEVHFFTNTNEILRIINK